LLQTEKNARQIWGIGKDAQNRLIEILEEAARWEAARQAAGKDSSQSDEAKQIRAGLTSNMAWFKSIVGALQPGVFIQVSKDLTDDQLRGLAVLFILWQQSKADANPRPSSMIASFLNVPQSLHLRLIHQMAKISSRFFHEKSNNVLVSIHGLGLTTNDEALHASHALAEWLGIIKSSSHTSRSPDEMPLYKITGFKEFHDADGLMTLLIYGYPWILKCVQLHLKYEDWSPLATTFYDILWNNKYQNMQSDILKWSKQQCYNTLEHDKCLALFPEISGYSLIAKKVPSDNTRGHFV